MIESVVLFSLFFKLLFFNYFIFQAESNKIYNSADELKLAIADYVKESEEPASPDDEDRQDSFSNRVWTLKKEDDDHWTLNKMFTFTDTAFRQLNWTGFVTPQASFTEMLVDVSVQGDDVLFMLNQIVTTSSR